jgi:hypothetical protein
MVGILQEKEVTAMSNSPLASGSPPEPSQCEKPTNNDGAVENSLNEIIALMDFHGSRAVAHANLFVASIFGIFVYLTLVYYLNPSTDFYKFILSILFLGILTFGFYELYRFGGYASIADSYRAILFDYFYHEHALGVRYYIEPSMTKWFEDKEGKDRQRGQKMLSDVIDLLMDYKPKHSIAGRRFFLIGYAYLATYLFAFIFFPLIAVNTYSFPYAWVPVIISLVALPIFWYIDWQID